MREKTRKQVLHRGSPIRIEDIAPVENVKGGGRPRMVFGLLTRTAKKEGRK